MKKKVIVSLLVGAGIANMSAVAEATEIKEEVNNENTVVEVAQEGVEEETFDKISEEDILETEVPGIPGDVFEPVDPDFSVDAEVPGIPGDLLNPVDPGFTMNPELEENLENPNAGDGSHEDNMSVVSDEAYEQLNYAIEEMRIAINLLEAEGMTVENRERLLTFGATAIERIKPYWDEIEGSNELKGHLDWISESWGRIFEANENYLVAGDGSHEDNMEVDPEVPGIPGDLLEPVDPDFEMDHDLEFPVDPDFSVDPEVPGIPGDLLEPVDPDFEIDHDLEFPVDPDFTIDPELEQNIENPNAGDGSHEDDMEVTPEIENPNAGDGSHEDDMEVTPEIENPNAGDGSHEDNMQVTPKPTKPSVIPETGVGSGMTLYASALLGLAAFRKKLKK